MLKNVVLPAPFGPMRLTIDPSGTAKSTSSTATRPPNSLRSAIASRRGSVMPLPLDVHQRLVVHTGLELVLATLLGNEAARTEEHDCDDDHPVDPEVDERCVHAPATDDLGRVRRVRVAREDLVVEARRDAREPLLVQVREERRTGDHAPDVPHPAEDDHAQDEDRDLEVEVVREDALLERAEPGAGDASEERPRRIRPGLGAHEGDAHRGCRDFVLADCDPRTTEARVTHPEAAED